MQRHVLVIYPHPDDETLATGGVIALHAKQGVPVTYACFTMGQMGRNMGKPFFANRETLPKIREKELRDACEALGISDLRLMGYRDKTLEFEDPEHLADVIQGLIQELNPSLVITYYPGYCVHPDHEALAEATVRAIRRLPAEERPVLQCQAFAQGYREALGDPDAFYDTSSVFESVFAAVKAHKSQTSAWVEVMEQELQGDSEARTRALERFQQDELYTYTV